MLCGAVVISPVPAPHRGPGLGEGGQVGVGVGVEVGAPGQPESGQRGSPSPLVIPLQRCAGPHLPFWLRGSLQRSPGLGLG